MEWQEQEEKWEDEEEDEDEDEVLVLGVLVRRSRIVYYFLRSCTAIKSLLRLY